MKYRRRGFEETKAEARRIAEGFLATAASMESGWSWQCGPPEADERAPGFDRRKAVIGWRAWVRPKPPDGATLDGGDGWLLVDIQTKEARWDE